jgi:hypothetical protein
MSIGVIGNSHVLAIRDAFEHGESAPAAGFYALVRDWVSEPPDAAADEHRFVIRNTWPVADDPGVDLGKFACFVICACGWWAARNEHLETMTPPFHPLGCIARTDWGYDHQLARPTVQLVSAAAFRVTVEAWIRQAPVVRLAVAIAARFRRPILLQPWPAPGRTLATDADWVLNRWYGARGPAIWREFFLAQHAAVTGVARELGSHVTVLDYPLAESLRDGFMDSKWCEDDPFHANEKYGTLVLNQIRQAFDP